MNKWLEILLGLILLAGGIYFAWSVFPEWGSAAISFLKGGIVWLVILAGILLIFLGINDLKD